MNRKGLGPQVWILPSLIKEGEEKQKHLAALWAILNDRPEGCRTGGGPRRFRRQTARFNSEVRCDAATMPK